MRLLEEALLGLGVEDSFLMAKTLGGLVRALRFTGAQQQALVYAQQGVAMARRLADPELLGTNLEGTLHIPSRGQNIGTSSALPYATEMLPPRQDSERASNLLLDAHYWARVYCLVELGEMPAADAEIDAYARLAEESQQPLHLCLDRRVSGPCWCP